MELDEQIKVMQHYADGKEVEIKLVSGWEQLDTPKWDWAGYDYRIKKVKPEPVYYYRWKRLARVDHVQISDFITDIEAEESGYLKDNWVRIESSKTTFEELV